MSSEHPRIPMRHYDAVIEELIKTHKLAEKNGVPEEVMASIERSLHLAQLKDEFNDKHSSKDSDGCAHIIKETLTHDWDSVHKEGKSTWRLSPGMMSGTLEGQFLKSVISGQKAKKVLELGMFTGFGALAMAEALPEDGQVVTVDNCPYLGTMLQPTLDKYPHGEKVKIVIGDAIKEIKAMAAAGENFDVIFLDVSKQLYEECLKICFEENLLAPHGTLLIDNAYMHGKGFDPAAGETIAKKFADYLDTFDYLHKVVLPLRDGVYMVRRMSEVIGKTSRSK